MGYEKGSVAAYLDHLRRRRLSANTVNAASIDLGQAERHLRSPLLHATAAGIGRYLRSLDGLAATSVRRKIASLRGYFEYLRRQDYRKDDPMGNVELPRVPKRLPVYLNPVDIRRLLDMPVSTVTDTRRATVIKLLFYTGIRMSEAINLDVTDLDWDTNQLRVVGKGDKERMIPVTSALAEALQQWLAVRPGEEAGPLLVTVTGATRLSQDTFADDVRQAVNSVGLDGDKYTPHKLRHTCATELLRKGVPLEQISQILGHAKLDTTMIYAHTEAATLRSALDRLT